MQEQRIETYLENLVPARNKQLQEIEAYAKQHEVPIMELIGMETLIQLLRVHGTNKMLEIGTAIGYSALRIVDSLPQCSIVSLERDESRYQVAVENVKKLQKEGQVVLIQGDALETEAEVAKYAPYDAIFIDAAKGQYRKFFDLYTPYLTDTGMIITDNVLFHGLVAAEKVESRNVRQLVRKINDYNNWLMNHPDFHTVIIPVGDGIAISKKRG